VVIDASVGEQTELGCSLVSEEYFPWKAEEEMLQMLLIPSAQQGKRGKKRRTEEKLAWMLASVFTIKGTERKNPQERRYHSAALQQP